MLGLNAFHLAKMNIAFHTLRYNNYTILKKNHYLTFVISRDDNKEGDKEECVRDIKSRQVTTKCYPGSAKAMRSCAKEGTIIYVKGVRWSSPMRDCGV